MMGLARVGRLAAWFYLAFAIGGPALAPVANADLLGTCGWWLTRPFIPLSALPLEAKTWRGLDEAEPYAGLVTTQNTEWTGAWQLEGAWPVGLHGRYLRMGPFGFDSASGQRKRSIIDSAGGMIREFSLNPAAPLFRNRHIQTLSYLAERAAGRFLYPSIDTVAPGEWNGLHRGQNQASVAVYPRASEYWVTDEWQTPVAVNSLSLETKGAVVIDPAAPAAKYLAHAKLDPNTGNLCFLSIKPGRLTQVHAVCVDQENRVVERSRSTTLPEMPGKGVPYFHDWALTPNHLVLFLHPQTLGMIGMLRSVLGLAPLMAGLHIAANQPAQILLIPRTGGAARVVTTPSAVQVWHFINAFEENGEVVLDIAGNQPSVPPPGPAAPSSLYLSMIGAPIASGPPTVFLHRYRIDAQTARLNSVNVFARDANYEFPFIAPNRQGLSNRYVYLARSSEPTPWHNGVAKWDHLQGRMEHYQFPAHQFSGEPVFAPRTGAVEEDDGYLLVDVYDGIRKVTHLAVFDARNVAAGPVARLWLPLHMPIGFHGTWLN